LSKCIFYKNSDRYAQKSKFITEKTKTVVNNVTMCTNKSMFTMAGPGIGKMRNCGMRKVKCGIQKCGKVCGMVGKTRNAEKTVCKVDHRS